MDYFGLGDGSQNHNLRKRKPKILDDDQLSFKSSTQSKSLRSIADNLNAVNKNLTLEKCLQNAEDKKLNKKMNDKFAQLYEKSQDCENDFEDE